MGDVLETIRQYIGRLRDIWQGMSLNQKVLVAGAVLLVIAAGVVSSTTLMKTEYVPLYSKLDADNAYQMTTKLTELGIQYQLADGGTTILVPPEQKYQAALDLAGAGLPKSTPGLELFNTTNFGETETDKKVKFQMALQGELTRSIQSLSKVEAAKVNLVMPEKRLLQDDQEDTTASVVVKLKADQELTRKEINAVVHLVASSVEGLKPDMVTLVDSNGTLLSDLIREGEDSPSSSIELTQAQLAIKTRYEKELQTKAQTQLESILGPGRAVTRVTAELNFDKKMTTTETYGPNSVVRSEHILDESSTKYEETPGGVPGTATNIPSYQQETANAQGSSSSQKSEKTRNYEIDNTKTQQEAAPWSIKRVTVSVVVDKDLDTRQSQDMQSMVSSAIGLDNTRGDEISVVGMRFTRVEQPPPEKGWVEVSVQYWWLLAPMLLALLAAIMLLMRRLTYKPPEPEMAAFDAMIAEDINVEDLVDRDLSPEEREARRIREEIEKLVDTKPEEVANILRTWLLEDMR